MGGPPKSFLIKEKTRVYMPIHSRIYICGFNQEIKSKGIGVGDSVYSNPLGNFRNIGEPQHHPGDLPYFRGKPTKWAKSNLRICWRIELCLHLSRGCYKPKKLELQRNTMWFFTSKNCHCFVQQKVGVTCNMHQQKMEEQPNKMWIIKEPVNLLSTSKIFQRSLQYSSLGHVQKMLHKQDRYAVRPWAQPASTSRWSTCTPNNDGGRWGVCYFLGHVKCECLDAKLIQLVNDEEDVGVPRMWCKWIWDATARCWSRSTLKHPFLG